MSRIVGKSVSRYCPHRGQRTEKHYQASTARRTNEKRYPRNDCHLALSCCADLEAACRNCGRDTLTFLGDVKTPGRSADGAQTRQRLKDILDTAKVRRLPSSRWRVLSRRDIKKSTRCAGALTYCLYLHFDRPYKSFSFRSFAARILFETKQRSYSIVFAVGRNFYSNRNTLIVDLRRLKTGTAKRSSI